MTEERKGAGGAPQDVLGLPLYRWLAGAERDEDAVLREDCGGPIDDLAALVARDEARGPHLAANIAAWGQRGEQLVAMRRAHGGRLPAPGDHSDPLLAALVDAATVVFPLLLLDREVRSRVDVVGPWSPALHPRLTEDFCKLARADEDLRRVMLDPSDERGPSEVPCAIMTSVGAGSGFGLGGLGPDVLVNAADRMKLFGPLTLDAYLGAIAETLDALQELTRTGRLTVRAVLGFRGIGLPKGARLAFPWGNLVPVEERHFLDLPQDRLSSLARDETGEVRECACVLECNLSIAARVASAASPQDLPKLMDPFRTELQVRVIQTMSVFALADHRFPVVHEPSWLVVADPARRAFHRGYASSPGLPRASSFARPDECNKLTELAENLAASPRVDARRMRIACSRLTRTVGERIDPLDGLIDAVVGLEALCGGNSASGERLATAAVELLGEAEKGEVWECVKRLHKVRSRLLHGDGTLDLPWTAASRARDEALELLRRVFAAAIRPRSPA